MQVARPEARASVLRRYGASQMAWARSPHLYPHLLILLPSPWSRGEGLGVRGFALCFDWFFDREFNV